MTTPESKFKKQCVGWAKEVFGMEAIHLSVKGGNHWPDTIFVGAWGLIVWVEFKRPDRSIPDRNPAIKRQSARIEKLKALGHHAFMTNDFEHFKEEITDARHRHGIKETKPNTQPEEGGAVADGKRQRSARPPYRVRKNGGHPSRVSWTKTVQSDASDVSHLDEEHLREDVGQGD